MSDPVTYQLRSEVINQATKNDNFDFIIIGGGIHGAQFARLSAAAGLKVLLLEKNDYASETSSRSSKMAHGGLRYLEMFDFEQVFEGIKSREELFELAPELVKPERFLIPISKYGFWMRLKLKIGLTLYDLLVKRKDRKHRWIPVKKLTNAHIPFDRTKLMGCFEYCDGLLNDARLVIDCISAARDSGAVCLNYAAVDKIEVSQNLNTVSWHDSISGNHYQSKGKLVINCAGPWANDFTLNDNNSPSHRFSRGAHILFKKKWEAPSLFLPMEEKGRYYFVWPHPSGTMVGTTERELTEPVFDPQPSKDEVEELFTRLEKDLPNSGLSRESAHYCFAGIRSLPIRGSQGKKSSQLSRKHIWHWSDKTLSLFGGKLTSASWTVLEGLKIASSRLENPPKIDFEALKLSPYPAGNSTNGKIDETLVRHTIENEQAATIEDIMRRRLNLELMPGNGLENLELVCDVASKIFGSDAVKSMDESYRLRISIALKLLGK